MTIRLKIGRKGCMILPKAIRGSVGLDEGDKVAVEVEVGEGIILRPVKKFEGTEIEAAPRRHLDKLRDTPSILKPKPGEPSKAYLEEEFEA